MALKQQAEPVAIEDMSKKQRREAQRKNWIQNQAQNVRFG